MIEKYIVDGRIGNYLEKHFLAIDIAVNLACLKVYHPVNKEVIKQGVNHLNSLLMYSGQVNLDGRSFGSGWGDVLEDELLGIIDAQELFDIYQEEVREKTFIPPIENHVENLESLLKDQVIQETERLKTETFFDKMSVRYLEACNVLSGDNNLFSNLMH